MLDDDLHNRAWLHAKLRHPPESYVMPTCETCQGCGRKLVISEDAAANYPKCPACGAVVLIQGSVLAIDRTALGEMDTLGPPLRTE